MKALLKSPGLLVWNYANGIDPADVTKNSDILQKGVGNSTTINHDVTDAEEAHVILLSLTEKVAMRLRRLGYLACLVSVSVKTDGFIRYTHQVQLYTPLNTTTEIYEYACGLFDEGWRGEPVRQLGVSVSDLCRPDCCQLSLFESKNTEKNQKLDQAVDQIRIRYGDEAVIRGIFANSGYKPIQGGTHDGAYIMMGGYSS